MSTITMAVRGREAKEAQRLVSSLDACFCMRRERDGAYLFQLRVPDADLRRALQLLADHLRRYELRSVLRESALGPQGEQDGLIPLRALEEQDQRPMARMFGFKQLK